MCRAWTRRRVSDAVLSGPSGTMLSVLPACRPVEPDVAGAPFGSASALAEGQVRHVDVGGLAPTTNRRGLWLGDSARRGGSSEALESNVFLLCVAVQVMSFALDNSLGVDIAASRAKDGSVPIDSTAARHTSAEKRPDRLGPRPWRTQSGISEPDGRSCPRGP